MDVAPHACPCILRSKPSWMVSNLGSNPCVNGGSVVKELA